MEIIGYLFFLLIAIAIFAIPLIFVSGIVYLFIRAKRKNDERIAAYQAFAREMGFSYSGTLHVSQLASANYFYLFTLGHAKDRKAQNLVQGSINGSHVSIFDYVYTTGRGKNYKGHYQTVMMLESPKLNLPLFSLRPEGAWQMIGEMFGGQDIDFASNPVFSSKYQLRGADERHIRQTFNNSVLSFFDNTEGLSVEGGGNRIFAYRLRVLIEPQQLRGALDEGLRIANLFQS